MPKHLLKMVGVTFLASSGFVCVFIGTVWGFTESYATRIAPGMYALGIPLGGLTRDDAQKRLDTSILHALEPGLRFSVEGQSFKIKEPLIRYQTKEIVDFAFAQNHTGHRLRDAFALLRSGLYPHSIPARVHFDRKQLFTLLDQEMVTRLPLVHNAQFHVTIPENGPMQVNLDAEQIGKQADLSSVMDTVETQIKTLKFSPILVAVQSIHPSWKQTDVEQLLPQIPLWLAHAPFKLRGEDHEWTVTSSTLAEWLTVASSTQGIGIIIDPIRLKTTLQGHMGEVVQEAKNGTLTMENEKIKIFEPAKDGITFDLPQTIQEIETGWEHGSSTIMVRLEKDEAKIQGPDAERLGIRETLGVGKSNFSGSPTNRRKNIALGAKKVNLSLLAPNQEFSLLKTIGSVNGVNGWFKELVIKGDKTVPEYGGGLCQIGTTTFRAALAAGLPITQRQNHSYRVRYYEPAGTDATIYEPSPDFRFKNDTSHSILISTEMRGDVLLFTVWGTRDGRRIEQTPSRIYHIVAAPPKKIIESIDIPVGTTKCTEVAHAGADASFDYNVTYPSGETKKVTFTSHYRPWGAVCLVGVAQLTQTEGEKIDETGVNNPN